MVKIAMIGAGSLVFCQTLVKDILETEALQDSEICLMSRTKPKLDKMFDYVTRLIRDNNLPARVSSTLDRKEALNGARYVIVMIQVGGVDAFELDYKIPLKYGVDQCIGDSLGPGGVFRALRTIPVLLDIAEDMKELCPDALMLNYANPMGANCTALGKATDISFIGLCHGVQTTLDLISRYVEVPKDQIEFLAAGINHMAWFLSIRDRRNGLDLNPVLREKMEDPAYYVQEKVRAEVMRHFGYFMTESTGHLSEYLPWFRSSKRALETYCDQPDFGGESGAYFNYCRKIADKFEGIDYLENEPTGLIGRSVEYCSYILEAVETDRLFRLNGNVRNDGYISNLPAGCCVEVPVYVDSRGLHPERIGELPPQCAAMNQSNITVQELTVQATLSGNPEYIMHAVAMDPLTAAVCTLKEIREMVAEMLESQREWLPRFGNKELRPVPEINIPEDISPVDVPLDPALAIVHRFGELAEKKY